MIRPARALATTALFAVAAASFAWANWTPQTQGPNARAFSIAAKRYTFAPNRLEVVQGDLVRIELRTEDIAHSFTIDEYRVSKRVGPEQPVTFEFRADRPGTFRFYCALRTEDGCREMHGDLVVRPRD